MKKFETFKESTITIVEDDVLVGIIYNDPELRRPIVYSCKLTPPDDIAEMISGTPMMVGRSRKSGNKKVEEITEENV